MSPFYRWQKGTTARAMIEVNVHLRRIGRIIESHLYALWYALCRRLGR